jgi:hypothetical protein
MGDALKIIQVNLDEVVKFITCVIEKRIMLYFITRRNNICREKKKSKVAFCLSLPNVTSQKISCVHHDACGFLNAA